MRWMGVCHLISEICDFSRIVSMNTVVLEFRSTVFPFFGRCKKERLPGSPHFFRGSPSKNRDRRCFYFVSASNSKGQRKGQGKGARERARGQGKGGKGRGKGREGGKGRGKGKGQGKVNNKEWLTLFSSPSIFVRPLSLMYSSSKLTRLSNPSIFKIRLLCKRSTHYRPWIEFSARIGKKPVCWSTEESWDDPAAEF